MTADLTARYDTAAPAWGDKMRALGYFDGYLGFLSESGYRAPEGATVLDVGAGTAAFAEAWIAIQGPHQQVTLLEPSPRMAERGAARLAARGVAADLAVETLEGFAEGPRFDVLLAAHVIEHGEAAAMLGAMRRLAKPGARLWLVVSKPHWCNAIIWFQWRHRTYQPDVLSAMLEASGWALTSCYAFNSGPPSRTSRGYMCRAA